MSAMDLRVKRRKKLQKPTRDIIAEAIREGKSAYEIAFLVKLSEDDVRRAAKALGLIQELNANEGCMTRPATPAELGLDEIKEKLKIGPDEDVEFYAAPEPVNEEPEPEAEKPRRRGRKPKAAAETEGAAKAEAPRKRGRKPGPKPGTKVERKPRLAVSLEKALTVVIQYLEDLGTDMTDNLIMETVDGSLSGAGQMNEDIMDAITTLKFLSYTRKGATR